MRLPHNWLFGFGHELSRALRLVTSINGIADFIIKRHAQLISICATLRAMLYLQILSFRLACRVLTRASLHKLDPLDSRNVNCLALTANTIETSKIVQVLLRHGCVQIDPRRQKKRRRDGPNAPRTFACMHTSSY